MRAAKPPCTRCRSTSRSTRCTAVSLRHAWHRAWMALALLLGLSPALAEPPPLPAFGLPATATVSGLSSGGYMAAQFAVAYSASVSGVGVVAGGPYDCAQGDVLRAVTQCSCAEGGLCQPPTPEVQALLSAQRARGKAAVEQIDPVEHLRSQRVWLFSGGEDHTVPASNVATVGRFYRQHMGLPAARLRQLHWGSAGHGLPVEPRPADAVDCPVSAFPFLTGCGLDAAREILAWLHPGRLPAEPSSAGTLQPFDQRPYLAGLGETGLGDTGYLFVPEACRSAGAACALHVVFHGCLQAAGAPDGHGGTVGEAFAREAGFNRWAAAARVVVLYPQVRPVDTGAPMLVYRHNPKACWDFWGYTQPWPGLSRYATQQAPQMQAVRAMMAALQR